MCHSGGQKKKNRALPKEEGVIPFDAENFHKFRWAKKKTFYRAAHFEKRNDGSGEKKKKIG